MKKIFYIFLIIFSQQVVSGQQKELQKSMFRVQLSAFSYNNLHQTLKQNSDSYDSGFNPSFELALINKIKALDITLNTKYSTSNFKNYDVLNKNNGVGERLTINAKSISAILKLDYNYYTGKKLNLYAGGGLGFSVYDINNGNLINSNYFNNDLHRLNGFAYQFDILGLNYSLTKRLNLYSIIGYGVNGYSQVGLNYAIID